MGSTRGISVPELTKRMGCSIPHAHALIRTKRSPSRKTARGWVTTVATVEKYLRGHPRKRIREEA